jgi:hypothetical protein
VAAGASALTRRASLALTAAALLVAVAVRVLFLADKPFWRDEAWVAELLGLPVAEILERARAIPIGFACLVKGVSRLVPAAPPEVALRLVPLAAGLAAIALLPSLTAALGGSLPTGHVALWLAAGMPALVFYSRELKPWSLDLMLAVLLPLLAQRARAGAMRAQAALALLLVATPWVSFGGLFPAAAVLLYATLRSWRLGGPRQAASWLATALGFGLSLAAAFASTLGRQVANPLLRQVWQNELPSELSLRGLVHSLWEVHAASLPYLFPRIWLATLGLAIVGACTWPAKQRAFLLWLWLGSATMAALVAATGLYLLEEGRFVLFLAPPVLLLTSGGLVAVLERAWPRRGAALAISVAMLGALFWTGQAISHRLRSAHSDRARYFLFDIVHDVAPLIDRLDRDGVSPQAVMVSRYAANSFRYYRRGRLPGAFVCGSLECREFRPAFDRWLASVEADGYLLLTDEEAVPGRRQSLENSGFEIQEIAAARGACLWRIRRVRSGAASPPRTR